MGQVKKGGGVGVKRFLLRIEGREKKVGRRLIKTDGIKALNTS